MSEGGKPGAPPRIHPADPALRRLMPAIALGTIALLLLLGIWYQSYLNDLPMDSSAQMRDSSARPLASLRYVVNGSALLLLLYAAYLRQRRGEVLSAPQYPAPGTRLFHSMIVLEGPARLDYARRLLLQALGCLLAAVVLLGAGNYWLYQQNDQHPWLDPATKVR
jgi:hypothetical protein